jgi:hypothetical protein
VWDELELLVMKLRLPERSIFALSDATFGYRVRNATYRAAAEIDIATASRDLRLIASAGLLDPIGDGRARHYKGTKVLSEIRERAREKERRPEPSALHQLELFGN